MDDFWTQKIAQMVLGAACGVVGALIVYLVSAKAKWNSKTQRIVWVMVLVSLFGVSHEAVIPRFLEWNKNRIAANQRVNPPFTLISEDHLFTITFPAGLSLPKKETQILDSPVGKIKLTTYSAEKDALSGFIVNYSEYPDSVFTTKPERDILLGAGDGGLKAMGAEPINPKFFNFRGIQP